MTNLKSAATQEINPHRNLAYVPTFHFEASKPCYCNSGRAFGLCCKNSSVTKQPPKNIHVINNYLSASECKRFIRFSEKQKRTWLSVVDDKKADGNKSVHKRDPSRVTQHVKLGKKQEQANQWFKNVCKDNISNLTTAKPQWFESSQLLRYGPEGKYNLHADAEHFDHETRRFYRFIDRDFSMLIYLNDDYQGGGISFPWLNYTYQPVAGDLVFFPSNHVYAHESLPITSGTKYALVSWGAFRGSPRIAKPKGIVNI